MWSLGTLLWLPAAVILVVVCLGVIAYNAIRAFNRSSYSTSDNVFAIIVAAAVGVMIIAGTAWGMYPYKAEYHKWITTTGKVDQVSSRLLGSDKSMTQRFVVNFTDGRQRSCDDTRCSLIKPGDTLTLQCKKHWQYAGQAGYDCNYISRRSNG